MGYLSEWSYRRQQAAKGAVQFGGDLLGGAAEAFSDRVPTPKAIGGPLTNLGEAATSTALNLGEFVGNIYESGRTISGDVQDITGRTYGTAKDAFETVVGVPGTIIEGATVPVGQLTKDVLPLAAIAAAVLLLR